MKNKASFNVSDFLFLLKKSDTISKGLELFLVSASQYRKGKTEIDIINDFIKSPSPSKNLFDLLNRPKLKPFDYHLVMEVVRQVLMQLFSMQLDARVMVQQMIKNLTSSHFGLLTKMTSVSNKSSHIKCALRLLTLIISGGLLGHEYDDDDDACQDEKNDDDNNQPKLKKRRMNKSESVGDEAEKTVNWNWIGREVAKKVDLNHNNWKALVNRKDAKDSKDVKHCLIIFISSFLHTNSGLNMLIRAKDLTTSLMHSLVGDRALDLTYLLNTLTYVVAMNKSIKKNLKLKIFNETNLIAIGQLYRWAGFKTWKEMAGKRKKYQQEEIDGNWCEGGVTEEQEMVRAAANELFTSLFTHPSFSILHPYHPYNHPLLNPKENWVRKWLEALPHPPHLDPLLRTLTTSIFTLHHDLFYLYVTSLDASFSPRSSPAWLALCDYLIELFSKQSRVEEHIMAFMTSEVIKDGGEMYCKSLMPGNRVMDGVKEGIESRDRVLLLKCLALYQTILCRLLQSFRCLTQMSSSELASKMQHLNLFLQSFCGSLSKNLFEMTGILKTVRHHRDADVVMKVLQVIQTQSTLFNPNDYNTTHLSAVCFLLLKISSQLYMEVHVLQKIWEIFENLGVDMWTVFKSDEDDNKKNVRYLLRASLLNGLLCSSFCQVLDRGCESPTHFEAWILSLRYDALKAGDKNRYNLIVDWLCELLCGLYMGADAVDRGLVERACESISQPHKKHSNLLQSFIGTVATVLSLQGHVPPLNALTRQTHFEHFVQLAFVDGISKEFNLLENDFIASLDYLKDFNNNFYDRLMANEASIVIHNKNDMEAFNNYLPNLMLSKFKGNICIMEKLVKNDCKSGMERRVEVELHVLMQELKQLCQGKDQHTQLCNILFSTCPLLRHHILMTNNYSMLVTMWYNDVMDLLPVPTNLLHQLVVKINCMLEDGSLLENTWSRGKNGERVLLGVASRLRRGLSRQALEAFVSGPIKEYVEECSGGDEEVQMMALIQEYTSQLLREGEHAKLKERTKVEECLKLSMLLILRHVANVQGTAQNTDMKEWLDWMLVVFERVGVDVIVRVCQGMHHLLSSQPGILFVSKVLALLGEHEEQSCLLPPLRVHLLAGACLTTENMTAFSQAASQLYSNILHCLSREEVANFLVDFKENITWALEHAPECGVFPESFNHLLTLSTNQMSPEELLAYIDCITSKIDSLSPTSTAALGLLQLLSSLCSGDFANKLQKKKTFVEICMNVLTKAMKLEGKRSQDIEDGNAQSGLLCANLLEVLASFVRKNPSAISSTQTLKDFTRTGLKYSLKDIRLVSSLRAVLGGLGTEPWLSQVWRMILNHSHFINVIMAHHSPLKREVVCLLRTISCRLPRSEDIYQKTMPLWFGAFNATNSTTDCCLLQLMRDAEESGCDISDNKPFFWGSRATQELNSRRLLFTSSLDSPTINDFLDCIDPNIMLQTALQFDVQATTQSMDGLVERADGQNAYNSTYFLTAFYHLLSFDECALDNHKFVDKHGLSLAIANLSSQKQASRKLGAQVLNLFYDQLDGSKFVDKDQYIIMLDALRNASGNKRCPSIYCCFLIRCCQVLLNPSNPLYACINQFILLKPSFDLSDVPEFYKLFFTSSFQHKTERSWLMSVLMDSIKTAEDFEVLQRRKVLKIVMSSYHSPLSDASFKLQMFLFILNICKSSQMLARRMVRQFGLLSWLSCSGLLQAGNLVAQSCQSELINTTVHILHTCWAAFNHSLQSNQPSYETCEEHEWRRVKKIKTRTDDYKKMHTKTSKSFQSKNSYIKITILTEFSFTAKKCQNFDKVWFTDGTNKKLAELTKDIDNYIRYRYSHHFKSCSHVLPFPDALTVNQL